MGKIFKPEDIYKKRVPDIGDIKSPIPISDIQTLIKEIKNLKIEIEKIKKALNAHGIKVE